MTSGLRSLRDKTLAFFDRALARDVADGPGALLDAVELYARCLRQVAEEDREALEDSDLKFNLHSGGTGMLRIGQTVVEEGLTAADLDQERWQAFGVCVKW